MISNLLFTLKDFLNLVLVLGEQVRQTIQELGGTMPEELPSVPSIKKLVKETDTKPIRKK